HTRSADMQYLGQMHDIAVPVPLGELVAHDESKLREAFYDRYREMFERVVTLIPVEALTWRSTVSAPAPHLDLAWRPTSGHATARKGERRAYFPELRSHVDVVVYDRYALRPGEERLGPAIIEERESTLVVGPGARLVVDPYGSLIVTLPASDRTTASNTRAEAV
ncbi:MAG: hypothetical protein ABIU95_08200, partial [Burkholderiales bacterium]